MKQVPNNAILEHVALDTLGHSLYFDGPDGISIEIRHYVTAPAVSG